MEKIEAHFGNLIRHIREERKMKVYELAKAVGVNPVYITQIEKHNKLPSSKVIIAISRVLNAHAILHFYITIKYPELLEIIEELNKRTEKRIFSNLLTDKEYRRSLAKEIGFFESKKKLQSE